jgi:site-specific DNA recombinase
MTAIRTAVAGIAEELAPPPGRAAIYCRLSRKGGRSIERQEKDGRKIAAEKGWQVAAVYRETASASPHAKKAREQWSALLEAIRAGQFDAVILWMEDRSARDVEQAAVFVRACREVGLVNLVLPSLDYDLSDPEDVAKFYGEVAGAQREVAKTSKRIQRARQQERDDGWPHPGGRRSFGEPGGQRVRDATKDEDDPEKWLTDEHGRWLRAGAIPDARVRAERELIREAARRILNGDSLRGVVLDWNGPPGEPQRVASPNGGRWTTQNLKRLLLSPRLAGLRDHGGQVLTGEDGEPVRLVDGPSVRGGQPVEPPHVEPILDRPTWEAVRAVLTDPARKTTAVGGVAAHLLTGLCYCGVCGAKLRAVRYTRTGEWVYRCMSAADGGRGCVVRSAQQVERLIERALFRAVESPEWDERAAKRPADDPTRPHYERLAELTAELDVLDRRIGEAELAEELGRRPHPSAATLRRMLADREAEHERHHAAVTRLQTGQVAAGIPRNLRQVWPDFSLDRRRAILKAVLRLPPEGKGIVIRPQGRGRPFDPEAIDPDWRQ